MMRLILLSLGLVSVTNAACPNLCSGHGTCGVDDVCTCYHGWGLGGQGGGDCSERFCPYELAWADNPYVDGSNHNYAECANKGTCDRVTGECKCFEGYEGKGCGRQSCPNSCSGHGTCEMMKDLSFGQVFNDYYDGTNYVRSGVGTGAKKFPDYSWDNDRARSCVCDGGWAGLACELRMCPTGNDIMDYTTEVSQEQTISLFDMDNMATNFNDKTFALQYTSKLNETFATQPIKWPSAGPNADTTLETYIEDALKKLPNHVISSVDAVVDSTSVTGKATIKVTFSGSSVQGKQHKLEILVDPCSVPGCTPLITGFPNIRSYHSTELSLVEISLDGSHTDFECGRRGKCDRTTGICSCFEGYAGDNCDTFTTI